MSANINSLSGKKPQLLAQETINRNFAKYYKKIIGPKKIETKNDRKTFFTGNLFRKWFLVYII